MSWKVREIEDTPVASQQPNIMPQCSDEIPNSEALVSPPVQPGVLMDTNDSIHPNPAPPQSVQTAVSQPQSTKSDIAAAPTIHGRYLTKYLPYALLDFDKSQVFTKAVSGTPENPLWWTGNNSPFKFDVSRQAELSIQIYLRNPAAQPRVEVIGAGSSGTIKQVIKKDTKCFYAFKKLHKILISSRSEVAQILMGRSVLAQINNPFILPLKFSFQSPEKLYLVFAYINGGELFYHLEREQRFDINRARFYIAELLCALECLHRSKIIYRDLSPQNILLDFTDHIVLCDFGLCKLYREDEDSTKVYRKLEYLAPELLLGHEYTKSVDFWTLGVLLYEMLNGLSPFFDKKATEMRKKIIQEPLKFPSHDIVPAAARDLLTRLLDRDPQRRLGANGASEIKAHDFFSNIDWCKVLQKEYEPAFKPNIIDAPYMSNFKRKRLEDSSVEDKSTSQIMQDQFKGWSYNQPIARFGDNVTYSSFPGNIQK